jgi:tetratricopeptide (TPR) repeat protein
MQHNPKLTWQRKILREEGKEGCMRKFTFTPLLMIVLLAASQACTPNDAKDYYNRGNAYAKKGQHDQAITDYTMALEIDSKFIDAYIGRGLAYYRKGQHDQAITDYTMALEINPRFAEVYNIRGSAYFLKGQYDQAITDYARALEINPRDATAYLGRGLAYYRKGQHDQAITDYIMALEIDSKFAMAYSELAWLMATCPEGRYRDGKRAVELAEKAVTLKDDASYVDTLAAAYAEAGRFQDATKTQERAITKLKQQGETKKLPKYEERLLSYKARKPWRE